MTEQIRASGDDYAVAAFQLNRAIIFMLMEKGILSRREVVSQLETFASVSEQIPSGASALYQGVIAGIKQNLPAE